MSTFTITPAVVRATLTAERTITRNYDGFVATLNLDTDTSAGDLTAAARNLVTLAYPTTDPKVFPGQSEHPRNRDARAIRAGLVRAIKRAADPVESDDTDAVNLLTADGVKRVTDMSDADLMAAIRAEMARRVK